MHTHLQPQKPTQRVWFRKKYLRFPERNSDEKVLDKERFLVLFVGKWEARKGLRLLLRAFFQEFPLISKSEPKVEHSSPSSSSTLSRGSNSLEEEEEVEEVLYLPFTMCLPVIHYVFTCHSLLGGGGWS